MLMRPGVIKLRAPYEILSHSEQDPTEFRPQYPLKVVNLGVSTATARC